MEAVRSARNYHSGHLHAIQRAAKSTAFENSVCAGPLVNARHVTQAQAHCCCTRAIRSGYNSKISSRTSSWFGSSVKYGAALKGTRRRQQRSAIVSEDSRIRWDSDDEGWVGGGYLDKGEEDNSPINSQLIPLLLDKEETHYKFLGLLPSADLEAVRVAFRKLAPVYHPDTSTLPKDVAEEKFVRLREAYEVLSDESKRRMYDWQLALQSKPTDADFVWPYETDRGQWGAKGPGEPWPPKQGDFDKDYMDGKVVELGSGKYALFFDLFAFVACILTATYILVIKNPAPS